MLHLKALLPLRAGEKGWDEGVRFAPFVSYIAVPLSNGDAGWGVGSWNGKPFEPS